MTARFSLVAGALLWASSLVFADTASLLWPLEMQPALSSTFGETRSTAFHAGIDLKTWGKTGYAVRAIADGSLLRARTSPWGYGRAVYQRLADGRIAVYAHLERFAEPLAARVAKAQQAKRQYSVQLWFEEDEIPVQRGQVLAYTGESGAGPPHLHLEIRSADNVPLNPLRQGLGPIQDTTSPTLRRILVQPLSPHTWIDGARDAAVVPLTFADGQFRAARPVRVWGRFGLAVESHDRADAAPNKMAVWQHRLLVDGRPVLTSTYDRVSYSDQHQVWLDRLRPHPNFGTFAALFRRPGNRLTFYEVPGGGDGALWAGAGELESGEHTVRIQAADLAGNQVEAVLTILAQAPPRLGATRLVVGADDKTWFLETDVADDDDGSVQIVVRAKNGGNSDQPAIDTAVRVGAGPFTWALPASSSSAWTVRAQDDDGQTDERTLAVPRRGSARDALLTMAGQAGMRHVRVRIASPTPLMETPRLHAGDTTVDVRQTADGWTYEAIVDLDGVDADSLVISATARTAESGQGAGRLVVSARSMSPGRAQDLSWFDGDVVLRVASGSAYEALYPQVARLAVDSLAHGLDSAGPACGITPGDVAFDKRVRISMAVTDGAQRAGVYADDGKGNWVFLGNDEDGDDRVSATIRAFGRFAVLTDTTAPTIAVSDGASGTQSDRPSLTATITDDGSGISREEDIIWELDGIRLIAEYDPDADTVVAVPDQDLAPGPHRWRLLVRDAVGNEAIETGSFVTP